MIKYPFLDVYEPGFRLYIHDKRAVSHINSQIVVVSPNNKISVGMKPIKVSILAQKSFCQVLVSLKDLKKKNSSVEDCSLQNSS